MALRQMGECEFIAEEDEGNFADESGAVISASMTCGWREHHDSVIEDVNTLLAEHGLEFVEYDTGGDFSLFSLVKKV